MIHLGDITKIDGKTVPVVDVVIGGSPCQDLSSAGKQKGLQGERSGLFMEQIRIVKEMRSRNEIYSNEPIRPRYLVWENVPGAFGSNRGEDFRTVLEEICRIADERAVIPRPANGKWRTCGCIMADGYSVAWRVLDAKFWGVPQRRRRIALVADFGGQSAPEILFVRESVQGRSFQSEKTGGRTSETTKSGIGTAIGFDYSMGSKARSAGVKKEESITLKRGWLGAACYREGGFGDYRSGGEAGTIKASGGCLGGGSESLVVNSSGNDISGTIDEHYYLGCCSRGEEEREFLLQSPEVRRLTPLECERLQGYPDGWTDIGQWTDKNGKQHDSSDTIRYKALGNSIAIPPWKWVLKRLCACYERDTTMASLFDGIGGFPYIWEQLNGKGSCLWASEIEEFAIAVTKLRIG